MSHPDTSPAILDPASFASTPERALHKQAVISAPIADVWQSWTTKSGIESFFAPEAEIDAQVGGAFHIHMDPYGEPGLKGADDMRFMSLQPPTMLSFDWNAPPSQPVTRAQRTFVVVRLFDLGGRSTRVTLHHVGWGEGDEWNETFDYFDAAWTHVLDMLKARHETGPRDWAPRLAALRDLHGLPAL